MTLPKLALIPSGYKASKVYSALPTNGDGDFTFSRTSNATRVNENGLIETVDSNVPRLDYLDSNCPSLLLEPQRTNLVTYSEDFANAVWTKTDASITNNSAIAPDGTLTADTLTATSNGGQVQQVYIGSSATEYVVSFWVKRKTGSGIVNIRSVENANTPITVTDEWTRFNLATTSTSTIIRAGINLSTIGDEVYIWGAQLEEGSYQTSYIPTEGSTVTRTLGYASGAGNSTVFNDSEGTLFIDAAALGNDGTYRIINISDGTTSNRVLIQLGNNNNLIRLDLISGGVTQASLSTTSYTFTDFNKIAIKYKADDTAFFVNGTQLGSTVTGKTMPTGLDRIDFQNGNLGSTFYFRGKLKQLMYFDTALSDAELISLTTL